VKTYAKGLDIENPRNYFNAGLLVFNTKKFREEEHIDLDREECVLFKRETQSVEISLERHGIGYKTKHGDKDFKYKGNQNAARFGFRSLGLRPKLPLGYSRSFTQ
jgi:hypothetical protein